MVRNMTNLKKHFLQIIVLKELVSTFCWQSWSGLRNINRLVTLVVCSHFSCFKRSNGPASWDSEIIVVFCILKMFLNNYCLTRSQKYTLSAIIHFFFNFIVWPPSSNWTKLGSGHTNVQSEWRDITFFSNELKF
jgi:hypothetical protein